MAVITGASGGIGGAIADVFENEGYSLALLDRRSAKSRGNDTQTYDLNLTNPDQVSQVFKDIGSRFGEINALVNVAGINHRASVREMNVADWDRVMDTNVGHMFLSAKFALPLMKSGASVVNMASVSGHVASDDYPAYVTSKAAVESFTFALSQEVGERGIRVNAVAPGWVNAGFTDAALAEQSDPEPLLDAARKAHLLGRMAEPEEIASTVLWLASDKSSFVTGQTLFVDGGFMRKH